MTVKKYGKYAAAKRPPKDDTVCVKVSVKDIYNIFSTISKLSTGKTVKREEMVETALSTNRLINRSRPYFRQGRHPTPDVVLKPISDDALLLSDIIRRLKLLSADWRKSATSIFNKK